MTNRFTSPASVSRRVICAGCSTEFACSLTGDCWCMHETARLPMPTDGGDCLCRDCLRKAATRDGDAASPQ